MPRSCSLSRSRILRDAFSLAQPPLQSKGPPYHHHHHLHQQQERQQRQGQIAVLAFLAPSLSSLCSVYSVHPHDHLNNPPSCEHHKASLCRGIPHATASRRKRPKPANARRLAAVRHFSSAASHSEKPSLTHQRFDSKGRLIIETTAPRQPAFSYEGHDEKKEQQFAAASKLPASFFSDINNLRNLVQQNCTFEPRDEVPTRTDLRDEEQDGGPVGSRAHAPEQLNLQLRLMAKIRDLEERLVNAKRSLDRSLTVPDPAESKASPSSMVLTKKDYLNLVDLYFYSHNSRFSPESPDASPTPTILNDYSFTLSSDFTAGQTADVVDEDAASFISPLQQIEEQLKNNKLREIAVMRVFVDLLLDDSSPNRALYEAYTQLPQPGVAHLPKGVLRLFLQRMATPWVKTQAAMLRYLSLIDEMQQANLPITRAEWSSAIYLAGRSFNRIENDEVGRAFSIWRQMENDAGVQSSHVTFNILFDVAVRAGKFALGETILTEMHKRNLRLNRMGRVSLMYYHGLRGDGDGVRKAYHDFVEAGEIVDTLVLNCVIASLVNAQEPTAAEQIYQRMKDMQLSFRKEMQGEGEEILFRLHPDLASNRIGDEMASNYLGRVLGQAPRLHKSLPRNHEQLQGVMPLTPNFTTFRIMLTHHAATSGDLDRMTVLLQDMLENFDIPLFPVVFQLLFKGFAIHGPRQGPNSVWSRQRLDMAWNACRHAIKDSFSISASQKHGSAPILPSVTEIKAGVSLVTEAEAKSPANARTLSLWEELVIDLATFPRERLKRIQRYHSQMFDEESDTSNFRSPFFQETHYAAPQPELDLEEGEYVLPDPLKSTLLDPDYQQSQNREGDEAAAYQDDADADEEWDRPPTYPQPTFSHSAFSAFDKTPGSTDETIPYRFRASKPLICWLLRAYSRVTGSRPLVEEVFGSVRKLWRPKDEKEAQIVLKVLLRCLRDCDRVSGIQ